VIPNRKNGRRPDGPATLVQEQPSSVAAERGVTTDAEGEPRPAVVPPAQAAAPVEPEGSGIRGIFHQARQWGELRRTPYGARPVFVITLIALFQTIDTEAFRLAAPDIIQTLEIDVRALVELNRIVALVGLFAALGVGWYADRHRRVPLLALGTLASGIMAMLAGRANSMLSLSIPRVADDAAAIAATVPAGSLLADYYPVPSRGRVFAVLGTLTSLGTILALPAAGFGVTYLGLRNALIAFGAPIAIMGVVALFTLREPVRGYFEREAAGADEEVALTQDEPQSFGEAWRTVWAVRTLRRLFFAQICNGAGLVVFAFYSIYLAEHYHLSILQRGLLGMPTAIVTVIGGYLGGGLLDFFGRRNPARVLTTLGIFGAITSLGLAGIAFGPPVPVLVAFSAVFGFGSALVGPATGAIFSQVIPPNVRTQGLQMTGLATVPAIIFVLPMALTIWDTYGYTQLFLFGVPFLVVGSLIAASAGPFFDFDRRSAAAQALAAHEWRMNKLAGRGKLLVCRGVDVEYDGVQVLFGVDLDIEEGEIVALLGTNGAGKSTLLRAISGSQEASSGGIVFDGRNITHMPPHEIAARGVVHMPGGRGVFPGLTVQENLMLANWLADDQEEAAAGVAEVFELFPILARRADEQASLLSGGEQQMLSLAQAFLAKPKLLMIDELSLGLAPAVVGQLLDVVKAIHARGTTIIVVEQSVNVALTIADKAVFMEKGEVRFVGPTEDLLRRPDILRAVYVKGTGGLSAVPMRPSHDRGTPGSLVLSTEGIVKRFGGVVALDGVDLELREGEALGLIGPNGSGKTTLFDIISGFQSPDAGVVRFQGVDITDLRPDLRARRKLIRRFQDARLYPSLTVNETLLVALEQQNQSKGLLQNAFRAPQARRADRLLRVKADRLIEMLELGAFRDKFVRELSTGLRRIVDLSCALAAEPVVLLLDEPSSGVAQAEAEALGPLLKRVRYETGCSLLMVEHDMPLISTVSDELVALERGRILVRGRPDEVLNDERVIEAYLGTSEAAVRRSGEVV
jgi:ABC-type branched-subunit amino acid transport system ATPase component/MFS family permease